MITTAKPKNVFEALLKLGHDEDFTPLANASFLPTDAPPGSPEKVEILRKRAELGQPLWHNDDRVDYSGLTGVIEPRYDSGPRVHIPVAVEKRPEPRSLSDDTAGRNLSSSGNGISSESKVRVPTPEEQRLLGSIRTALRMGSITRDCFISEVRSLMTAGVDVGDLRLELTPQEAA